MPACVHLKYWDQRYRLLSRFDKGIQLDDESWYSITPEAVAHHVTASCLGRARELGCKLDKIMDCFSGCGGNTIPFLAREKEVISVDFDPVKLGYLRWTVHVLCSVLL
jgi:trimethylguanosine synthase